jgi:hypothetical protein
VNVATSRYVSSRNQIKLFLAPTGDSNAGVAENPS